MEVRDKFTWKGYEGKVFSCVIVNKNTFREPSQRYLLDVYQNGEYVGEVFVGEDFFDQHEIETINI